MIEIRPFEGSATELSAFTNRVWRTSYEGLMPTPLWTSQHFDRDLLADGLDRDLLVAAYDGARLVGVHPAKSLVVRLHGRALPATWASFLSVDPDYRRSGVVFKLQDEYLRRHRERGLALNFGFTYVRSPHSAGPAYWRRQGARPVARLGLWALALDHVAVSRFETYRFEAGLCRLVGPLLPKTWARPDSSPEVRLFRAEDLSDCLALLTGAGERADLAYVWDDATAARQLDFPGLSRTVVLEREGGIRGFVNYTLIDFLGRAPLRSGRIDLVAFGALAWRDRLRLLRAALRSMAADGAKSATMLRGSWDDWRPLVGAGFLPLPPELDLVATMADGEVPLGNVRRLQVVWR